MSSPLKLKFLQVAWFNSIMNFIVKQAFNELIGLVYRHASQTAIVLAQTSAPNIFYLCAQVRNLQTGVASVVIAPLS